MNVQGNPASLIPAHPGNRNAIKHGVYSKRALQPRAREIADALLAAGHAVPLDQIAAEEIGSLVALVEAIDDALLENGLFNEEGEPKTLIDLRIRLSGRLQKWLSEFGATPASRVDWVEKLSSAGDMVETLRRSITGADTPTSTSTHPSIESPAATGDTEGGERR